MRSAQSTELTITSADEVTARRIARRGALDLQRPDHYKAAKLVLDVIKGSLLRSRNMLLPPDHPEFNWDGMLPEKEVPIRTKMAAKVTENIVRGHDERIPGLNILLGDDDGDEG